MADVEDMDVVAPAEEGDEAESPGDEKGPEFEPPQVCPQCRRLCCCTLASLL